MNRDRSIGSLTLALLTSAIVIAGLSAAGCSKSPEPASQPPSLQASHAGGVGAIPAAAHPSTGFPISRKDVLGKTVKLAQAPRRIVSLAPSATENLFAIGAGSLVVGGTSFDNYPPEAARLPKVGGFQDLSAEKILALHPDLVIAVRGNPLTLIGQLERFHVPVFSQDPRSIHDVESDLLDLGALTGHTAGAGQVVAHMENDLRTVRQSQNRSATHGLTGLLEISQKPYFMAGPDSFSGDVLQTAGVRNLAPRSSSGYPQISSEQILALRPQVYFVSEQGVKPSDIRLRPGWATLPAVKAGRLYPVDGDTIARPTPRVIGALRQIAADLYPGVSRT